GDRGGRQVRGACPDGHDVLQRVPHLRADEHRRRRARGRRRCRNRHRPSRPPPDLTPVSRGTATDHRGGVATDYRPATPDDRWHDSSEGTHRIPLDNRTTKVTYSPVRREAVLWSPLAKGRNHE